MKIKCIVGSLLFLTLLANTAAIAQSNELSKDERMKWWREARFGMFIHWGVYSQWGGVYHGHRQARGGAEWIMNRSKIPMLEYQERAKSFNPIHYDPDYWVQLAKAAGMKYLIITAKHHDGFALFDTKASTWDIVDATVYGKDLLAPLAEACRKHGIKLGFYYSQSQDWNNPGGATARKVMAEGWPNPDSAAIDAYTKANGGHWDPMQQTKTFDQYVNDVGLPQVKELLTNYGDIAVLWWDTPMGITDEQAISYQQLLTLQPHIITNDRLKRPNFPGDTGTPEQKIPDPDELDGRDWETCMTMNGSWGYKSWDHNWKSARTLIRNLIDIASKGGNYLLNIGPKEDGTLPAESVERLQQIGQWMEVNGESIYGTQISPLLPMDWGRCTSKKDDDQTILYLHVFDWPTDQQLTLPGLTNRVLAAELLGSDIPMRYKQMGDGVHLFTPVQAPDSDASVIKLTVRGEVANQRTIPQGKEMKTGALDTE
ncbi:alpha-L-fucosidase [Parapedobacter soli]|uniref:alpha-L-fucosidase n=1 Tax=Parapedobacter soli TaxID=416955 RepID=UPI0021C85ED4|nr:alpha-L-fucosidase [Parapedobacter soli]